MASFPEHADAVIVGQGGIVGASVAHHLIEQGWSNLVGLDKSAIPSDISSTSHASDFCYMTSHDRMSCYTTVYSRQFYTSIGHYSRVGGIEVARSQERMDYLKRRVEWATAWGIPDPQLLSPAEVTEKLPQVDADVIKGGYY